MFEAKYGTCSVSVTGGDEGEEIMIKNNSFGIRIVLATMMALAVAVTGCKDDDGGGGSGGTAGSGGMGGEGGTGGGIDISCDEGRCVDVDQATKCETAILACIAAEANEEECIAFGNLIFCNEGVLVPVFVTSLEYRGNFPDGDGLAGADFQCTELATNAGLEGTWTAWLSTDTVDARDRIADGEYRLLDGTLVADDKADLTDGTLDAPIIVREDGTPIPGAALEVWTGTGKDGTNSGLGTCDNWTDNTVASTAQSGRAEAIDEEWTANVVAEEACDIFNRLYCFAN